MYKNRSYEFNEQIYENQNAPQQLINLLTIDEVSGVDQKLSTWLIVVIAVSGVSLLALIIFFIKNHNLKCGYKVYYFIDNL